MSDDKPEPSGEIVTVEVNRRSRTVADCSEIVLRESKTRRLLLRAKLVTSDSEPGVSGHLVYQRKRANEAWSECDPVSLHSIKAGELIAIKLHSPELRELRQWLVDLQLIRETFGIPELPTQFIGLRHDPLANGPERTASGNVVVSAKTYKDRDLTTLLQAALAHEDLPSVTAALRRMSPEQLLSLQRELGVSALDALLREWQEDEMCSDEEHWQALLTRHSFALEQVLHTPAVIVKEKAYVGGKSVHNRGGNVADFLLKSSLTGRATIVEIKTPATPLLVKDNTYRNNIWNMHPDLSGSILQVLTYRDLLHEQLPVLDAERNTGILRRSPAACAVIIGHTSSLADSDQRRSFELARHRPDVAVFTFDEIKTRLRAIRDMLMTVDQAGYRSENA